MCTCVQGIKRGYWKSSLGALQEQSMLLTTESSLHLGTAELVGPLYPYHQSFPALLRLGHRMLLPSAGGRASSPTIMALGPTHRLPLSQELQPTRSSSNFPAPISLRLAHPAFVIRASSTMSPRQGTGPALPPVRSKASNPDRIAGGLGGLEGQSLPPSYHRRGEMSRWKHHLGLHTTSRQRSAGASSHSLSCCPVSPPPGPALLCCLGEVQDLRP